MVYSASSPVLGASREVRLYRLTPGVTVKVRKEHEILILSSVSRALWKGQTAQPSGTTAGGCVRACACVHVRVRLCTCVCVGVVRALHGSFSAPHFPGHFENVFGFNFGEKRGSQHKSTTISEVGGGCVGHYTLTTSLDMLGPLAARQSRVITLLINVARYRLDTGRR